MSSVQVRVPTSGMSGKQWGTYCVPGAMPGTGDLEVNEMHVVSGFNTLLSTMGMQA